MIAPARRCLAGCAVLLVSFALVDAARAQFAPPGRPGQRGLEETRPALPEFRPPPAPEIELPPVAPPPAREPPLSAAVRVLVNEIRLTGNTVFGDAELAPIIAPYVGREITTEELLDLRDALTAYYVERGYVNSGAVIPDQEVVEGVIEVQIVEGELADIVVNGLTSLKPEFVIERIRLGAGPPLNVNQLRERIQLLLLDPAIDRINARLGPGLGRGEGRLEVDIVEAPRYQPQVRFANDRSPAVGAEEIEVSASFGNIFGRSDPLRILLAVSKGLIEGSFDYSVPLTARDLRFFISGDVTHAKVVEDPFSEIDVESTSSSLQAGLSWPVIKTLDDEVRLEALLEREATTTSLLGRRFSFSEGVDDGRTKITALRLVQQWQRRSQDQVIALRSTESIGLDLPDTTKNSGNLPDGQFFAWLGQAQFARRLFGSDWQLVLRGDVQLSADPLLPIERIAIGGIDTVRGYRENQLVVDSGWITSAELRVPLGRLAVPGLSTDPDDGALQLVPFVDAGGGWNVDAPDPEDNVLYAAGAGLRWQLNQRIDARVDYAPPLVNISTPDSNNLQDLALYFELVMRFY
ncbi:MAG TPA: ShlB/FhaC/HecB family hemolysin secretion/activation protein [Geminicoccaceae bacterium]|nr:ShlB/FhaC/HecB family hemolysin secretion/activation protein [Geminicoccaceae bacterium]